MNGFINVIKPSGISSAKVVSAVKKRFHKPCGHMGTLDPMASGVLPVAIGKTCRLFDYLLDKKKTYVATFKFGVLTDTLDTTGTVTKTTGNIPSKEKILNKLDNFVGEIDQVPPKYSAKCVNGTKGYNLARHGVDFSLAPKKVTVISFKMAEQVSDTEYKFIVECKGGTYIRSLARDLGYATDSLAVMSALERTEAVVFNYENAVSLDDVEKCEDLSDKIIPSDIVISFDKLVLNDYQTKRLINGIKEDMGFSDGFYRVYGGSEFIGVGEVKDKILKIRAYVKED